MPGERRGAGRWRREDWSMRKETGDSALKAKTAGEGPNMMRVGRTADRMTRMLTELAKREPLSLHETSCLWTVSPLAGKTTDWRAGCGRSARPVRREGVSKPIDAPYPYYISPPPYPPPRAGEGREARRRCREEIGSPPRDAAGCLCADMTVER